MAVSGYMRAWMCLAALALQGCNAAGQVVTPTGQPFVVTEMATLRGAYSITFLPNGRMLVTTTDGRIVLMTNGGRTQVTVKGTPTVARGGQAALIEVVLHPDYARNQLVYMSYVEEGEGGKRGLVLARAELFADGAFPSLGDFKVIYRATPFEEATIQYGGRLAFAPDGRLFMTTGDRNEPDSAQDRKGALGKMLRFNDDGTPAPGSPLATRGFDAAAWSYGHRNPLGIAFDTAGNLWETEMGPKGGDELNLILPGKNYGWPLASNGDNYNDKPIPDHRPGDGYEAPRVWWNPSISPGSLMVYSGKLWPEWKGSIFLGALSGQALVRVAVTGTTARKADQWDMKMRVREVVEAPDGAIWLTEDKTGKFFRLEPAR